jgi:hypothetical protein
MRVDDSGETTAVQMIPLILTMNSGGIQSHLRACLKLSSHFLFHFDIIIIGHQSKDWFVAALQSSLFSASLFIPT